MSQQDLSLRDKTSSLELLGKRKFSVLSLERLGLVSSIEPQKSGDTPAVVGDTLLTTQWCFCLFSFDL